MTEPNDAARFAQTLQQRRRAAQGMERDLLHDVPLLYGSPGQNEPNGDPGVVLARMHRDELVRRNGGGIVGVPTDLRRARLPFERLVMVIAFAAIAAIWLTD